MFIYMSDLPAADLRAPHLTSISEDMKTINDPWQWLIQEGHRILKDVQLLSIKPLKIDTRQFRLDAVQQALLEEQIRFRHRSRDRFPDSDCWLWTDRSLQQASDWNSATYKASLFPENAVVMDACCGAGADLVALASSHAAVGIDRDRRMAELTKANLRAHALQANVCVADVLSCFGDLTNVALHIDPDRRAADDRGTRTTHGEAFSPALGDCMRLAEHARGAIIKLAPATDILLDGRDSEWRRCWLGSQRECPQQLLLRGELKIAIPAGQAGAVLCHGKPHPHVYCGEQNADCDIVTEPEAYVYEPHPVLYAAALAPAWAVQLGLSALGHPRGYYSGQQLVAAPWAQRFRVLDWLAWDDRRLRKWLRAHQVGTLEVKSRMAPIDASELQRRYSQPDGRPMTCLLTRSGKGLRAIMAERCSDAESGGLT